MYLLPWRSSGKVRVEIRTIASSEMIQNDLSVVPIELWCSLTCTKWTKHAVYLAAGDILW